MIRALLLSSMLLVAATSAQAQDGATRADWPSYGGTQQAWRYTALDQINTANVKNLVPAWLFQTGDYAENLQATPIVVDGVMYVITARNNVFALDAATGRVIWRYIYGTPRPGRPGTFSGLAQNRGVAVGDGKVFFGTNDTFLAALDQKTGREVWKVSVDDPRQCGCNIFSAPLVVKDKVIVGGNGSEMAHRGYLTAFYAKTGRLAWRWYAVPGPGEPGHDTWKGDSWRFGGGAPWMTGSFDPQPNLLYWGTGNPSPAYFDAVRLPGDGNRKNANLYTDCIVALDPDTGKLRWYYQELPGDVTDFDSAYEIILTDREVNGRPRKLLVHMNKSGVTFVLDRVSGEFVNAFSVAEVQNWISGVGKEGELAGRRHPDVNKSTNLCPSIAGAKSWNQMAFSPRTGLIYTPVIEICVEVTPNDQAPDEGGPYLNAAIELKLPPNRTTYSHVDAWDPVTGKRIWSYAYRYLLMASVLATAGDLVFTGDPEGDFFALDAKTGEKLWSYQTGAGHRGSAPCFRNLVARPRGYGPGQDNPWRPKLHFRQSAYLADAYGNTAGSQRALPKAD